MKTEVRKLTETWGERLDSAAQGMVARLLPPAPWPRFLSLLLRDMGRIASPATRFQRTEQAPQVVREAPPRLEEGFLMPLDVRERLRDLVGPGLERVRIHADLASDHLARTHRAHAVTFGDDVFFRYGSYRPREQRGQALLAHEATHVLEGRRPGASLRRSSGAGLAEEEARALRSEAQVLASPLATPSPVRLQPEPPPVHPSRARVGPAPGPAGAPANSAGTSRALAAEEGRSVPEPGGTAPPLDVAELKRSIYRDILMQIRSDAERGG